MEITELDKIAFELFNNHLIKTYVVSYNINMFVEEHLLFNDWYEEYYEQAKLILRTYKINKLNEKSINSSRCTK